MNIQTVFITPEIAKEILKGNTNNRKLKPHTIEIYAAMMKADKWKSGTAEPIKISETGRLLDGQNRLHAVIKSGKTIEFLVISELKEDIFDVLDTGVRRTASDTLYIENIKNANRISAGIKIYNNLSASTFGIRSGHYSTKFYNSNMEILASYNQRPEFWQNACKLTDRYYNSFSRIFSQAELIGIYAYLYDRSPFTVNNFLHQLCIDGQTNVPAILFARKLLINDKVNAAKATYMTKLAWVFNAWNIYRAGSNKKNVSFNPAIDAFPLPK